MAVSFSAAAKAEICRVLPQKKCCAMAQCFGILLFCNNFSSEGIRIITKNHELAAALPKLFRKAFGITFDEFPEQNASGNLTFKINDYAKIEMIMTAYGFDINGTWALHVNFPVVEDDCCKASFLRGAFLTGGSVKDPSKDYYLEIVTTHHSVARETSALMWETLGFTPKNAERGGAQVLSIHNSELISDVLTFFGAPVAAMGIMEARLEKELNNKVNRRCNCDDANTSKVVEAAQDHLAAIRVLRERGMVDSLPAKLQQAVIAREENPESSLTELAALMQPPISKPAMNHRLKKIVEIAKEAES